MFSFVFTIFTAAISSNIQKSHPSKKFSSNNYDDGIAWCSKCKCIDTHNFISIISLHANSIKNVFLVESSKIVSFGERTLSAQLTTQKVKKMECERKRMRMESFVCVCLWIANVFESMSNYTHRVSWRWIRESAREREQEK